jgi:hypothetical protein
MLRQTATGLATELLVKDRLKQLGLVAHRPTWDDGVDLEVHSPESPHKVIKIQVKGRGAEQTNGRYRWFQLRTTSAQRRKAIGLGFPASDAYKIKAAKSDFFVLVSLRFSECWVFSSSEVLDLIELNKTVYGERRDNQLGIQKEVDLDIISGGRMLSDQLSRHLNNFSPILRMARH